MTCHVSGLGDMQLMYLHEDTCTCKALKPSCWEVDEQTMLQIARCAAGKLLARDGETLW